MTIKKRASIDEAVADGLPDLKLPDSATRAFAQVWAAPAEVDVLRVSVDTHLDALLREQRVNEFLDADEARALARASHRMLDRGAVASAQERKLAFAAVAYFVLCDDADADFEVGGLDDDLAVMNAVARYLGWRECQVE